ncbi:MAG: hypothetical protein Q8922_02415 [Bacteroidota bacterium]|nr:hypothetical protein [Bacteroidota bacterium]MDP4232271.1 hypothetical protein [Bacteroidota bacterium]MDP4242672.1 hypothetical protein [Bacteroidota bacterium]MDP4286766.1 hypothetical protein [Bacteroidota bacterium]
MKRLLYCLLLSWPLAAFGQDTINPYNTQQPMTIYLQNTDVYYNPLDTPARTDTREALSSESQVLVDSNGAVEIWPGYDPRPHGIRLQNWAPYGGDSLGIDAHWQRYFTARDKWDRSLPNRHSDIIAGSNVAPTDTTIYPGLDGYPPDTEIYHPPTGPVIVSKNEDVDFRASGTIKLKNGFHVKPGAHFHAYIEPRWGDTVFTDDFTTLNRAKWHITNGSSDGYGRMPECSTDTNVTIWLDSEATDGHALDIIMREDSCQCPNMSGSDFDSCKGKIDRRDTVPHQATFSTAIVRACPWPYLTRDSLPLVPAYQHAPYGKFEIREKIPHILHHTNNWPASAFEVDINESCGPDAGYKQLFPTLLKSQRYGPFKGMFHRAWNGRDSIIFVSHDAQWSLTNSPHWLFIDNFPYEVTLDWDSLHFHDTIRMDPLTVGYMGWPAALKNDTTDSVTFYYARYEGNTTDSITWRVDTFNGKWRKFSAPYRVSGTDTFRFSKDYQPTKITLVIDTTITPFPTKNFNCHWEYNLNNPHDSGLIYLDDTMAPSDLHSFKERYQYSVAEQGYNLPAMPFDLGDSTGGYTYHTFGVEILPHEMRYMMDSNVMARLPDRLIPPSYRRSGLLVERSPLDLRIAQFDLDYSILATQRAYFEHAAARTTPIWPGFRDVGGKPAAHHLVDYVRIWDVPPDVQVSNFPPR